MIVWYSPCRCNTDDPTFAVAVTLPGASGTSPAMTADGTVDTGPAGGLMRLKLKVYTDRMFLLSMNHECKFQALVIDLHLITHL